MAGTREARAGGTLLPTPSSDAPAPGGRSGLGLGPQIGDAQDAGGASRRLSRYAEAGLAASKWRELGLELREPEAARVLEPAAGN